MTALLPTHPTMTGLDHAVALARTAVRADLRELPPGAAVVVGVSGGGDSLALAASVGFEAPRMGIRTIGVVVDHGLQDGSELVADTAAEQCRGLGLDLVEVIRVSVVSSGDGPESSARAARYAALEEAAARHGASRVLVAHTRDDQAEQVLLGLARGSGTRSLAGMPHTRGLVVRPFIGLTRDDTAAVCTAQGLTPWHDPHNIDRSYRRVRVRRLLADFEDELGPGIAAALARTAAMLREDAELLDDQTHAARDALGAGPWPVDALAVLPRPIRTRVWRMLLGESGSPLGSVTHAHIESADALLTSWHGQGPLHMPGAVLVSRTGTGARAVITMEHAH